MQPKRDGVNALGTYQKSSLVRVEHLFAEMVKKEAQENGMTITDVTRHIRYAIWPETDPEKLLQEARQPFLDRLDERLMEAQVAAAAKLQRRRTTSRTPR